MAGHHGPDGPDASTAAAVDAAAEALLGVWDAARDRAASQLSGSQLRALLVVERFDGINLRRLAATLGMLLSSASRLCDRLVAAGVLERIPGRVDRREISLHLTPEGLRFMGELRRDRREQLARVLGRMSPDGREALLQGLLEFEAVAGTTGGPAADVAADIAAAASADIASAAIAASADIASAVAAASDAVPGEDPAMDGLAADGVPAGGLPVSPGVRLVR